HHQSAAEWYDALGPSIGMVFCRHTQLGLLRLLTTSEAMEGRPLTQKQAWREYDRWLESGVLFAEEPPDIEKTFREAASLNQASPKNWADSYLAAFAVSADLRLVTFDRALHNRSAKGILLK